VPVTRAMAASPLNALTDTALPRLGFVGVGWIGANRLRAVAESSRAQIVAISDVRTEAATAAAASISQFSAPPSICSFDELLESGLDGVVIATPNAEHAPQCLAALDRGLSVFCQKPLARTRVEVAQIIDRARARDRLLDVDFCYRHVAGIPELKSRVQAGAIGNVYAADLTFHNAYGPDKPWFFDARSVGGGCVMDLGIHLVDLLLWVLEYPAIERVNRRLYRNGLLLETPSDALENYATAEVQFTSGLTARLACSWHLPAGRDAVIEATFYGTRGALRLRNIDGSFYDFAVEHCEGTSCRPISQPSRDWGGRAIGDWARRVATDARFDVSAERIEDVHRVLDAIYAR
jgi:predicted dehydrogenase